MLGNTRGVISADGRVRWDGIQDEGQTVVAINKHYIVEHMPSGGFYNNGGFNRTQAWLEVRSVRSIEPGRTPDTWVVYVDDGPSISWHPTQKVARADAIATLREKYPHKEKDTL